MAEPKTVQAMPPTLQWGASPRLVPTPRIAANRMAGHMVRGGLRQDLPSPAERDSSPSLAAAQPRHSFTSPHGTMREVVLREGAYLSTVGLHRHNSRSGRACRGACRLRVEPATLYEESGSHKGNENDRGDQIWACSVRARGAAGRAGSSRVFPILRRVPIPVGSFHEHLPPRPSVAARLRNSQMDHARSTKPGSRSLTDATVTRALHRGDRDRPSVTAGTYTVSVRAGLDTPGGLIGRHYRQVREQTPTEMSARWNSAGQSGRVAWSRRGHKSCGIRPNPAGRFAT